MISFHGSKVRVIDKCGVRGDAGLCIVTFNFILQTTKRSIHSLELLDLEQIKMLSEKLLVSYFAELSSNEMTRNFTFTCYLMPKVCKEQFKSFGNETQARLKMKKHLLKHLEQLEMDKNGRFNY